MANRSKIDNKQSITIKLASSSNQKENRPKKVKIFKAESNNCLGISKQLIKKAGRKTSRPKRKIASTSRVLPNMKPMPTLMDLEKMFEGSEDNLDTIKVAELTNKKSSEVENISNIEDVRDMSNKSSHNSNDHNLLSPPRKKTKLNTDQIKNDDDLQPIMTCKLNFSQEALHFPERHIRSEPVDVDLLISATTHVLKAEDVRDTSNKSHNLQDDHNLPLPKTRANYNTDNIEYDDDDLPPVMISPRKKCTTNSDVTIKGNEQIHCKDLKSCTIPTSSKDNEEKLLNDGNVSKNSTDSNKTIEYNLSTSMLQSELVSKTFSPLPSTSTDDITFTKNDELFFESLKEVNNNLTKENEKEVEVVESPTQPIIIDDELMEEPIDIIAEDDGDIKIIDDIDQVNLINVTETGDRKYEVIVDDDDDDCVFVETCTNTTKEVSGEPVIIDFEYDFIKTDSEFNSHNTENLENEIIDVDELIALNQSILSKYKKPDSEKFNSRSLVVDVDIPNIINVDANRKSNEIVQSQNNNQNITDKTSEDPNMMLEKQTHKGVINVSNNLRTENLTNISCLQSRTNNECEIIDVPCDNNIGSNIGPYVGIDTNYPRRQPLTLHQNRHLFTQNDLTNFFTQFNQPFSNITPMCNPPSGIMPNGLLLNLLGIVPGFTGLPNNNTVRGSGTPSTQANTSQRTQHATLNSHKKPKQKKKKQPLITNIINQHAPSPPESPRAGNLGECPICMDRLSGNVIASTICGHVFCMSCLQKAIKANKRCPTCRKVLKNNGYHQLFL